MSGSLSCCIRGQDTQGWQGPPPCSLAHGLHVTFPQRDWGPGRRFRETREAPRYLVVLFALAHGIPALCPPVHGTEGSDPWKQGVPFQTHPRDPKEQAAALAPSAQRSGRQLSSLYLAWILTDPVQMALGKLQGQAGKEECRRELRVLVAPGPCILAPVRPPPAALNCPALPDMGVLAGTDSTPRPATHHPSPPPTWPEVCPLPHENCPLPHVLHGRSRFCGAI